MIPQNDPMAAPHDPVPAVAQNALRHQLQGNETQAREALAELTTPDLRRLCQACVKLTSAAAQAIVAQAVAAKRANGEDT